MSRQPQSHFSSSDKCPWLLFHWLPHIPKTPLTGSTPSPIILPEAADGSDLQLVQRLWDKAYKKIEKSDHDLVNEYEKVLSRELDKLEADPGESSPNALGRTEHKPDRTRAEARRLVQQGLEKTEKLAKKKQVASDVIHVISDVKEAINSFVQAIPQAAFAWAGICFALQMLANPLTESEANRDGIVYVGLRIRWYSVLSIDLLGVETTQRSCEMQEQIVELFAALLNYQMKSVCSYYRNQARVICRDLFKVDDWEASLSRIHAAEKALQQDAAVYLGVERTVRLGHILDCVKDLHRQFDMRRLQELFLRDPESQIEDLEGRKDRLIPGCWEWIRNCKQWKDFTDWENGNDDRLLWITGSAGKGKTMLLIAIVRELKRLKQHQDDTTVTYYFIEGTDRDLNTPTAALRSLIWQLLNQQPLLRSNFGDRFNPAGQKLLQDRGLFYILKDVFMRILGDSRLSRVFLIVDALDECVTSEQEPGRIEFLDFITSMLPTNTNVKWLVSSQNDPDIKSLLKGRRYCKTLDLNSESKRKHISRAVNNYIEKKLVELNNEKHYSFRTREYISIMLRKKAEDTFLWVSLACKELKTVSSDNARAVLHNMPTRLKELYAHMMQQINRLKGRDPEFCKRVLAIMVLTCQAVHVRELSILASLPSDVVLTDIIWKCGSFLSIHEETVCCLHQSAIEYLEDMARAEIFPNGQSEIHAMITSRLLQAMSNTLRRDIYNLGDPGCCLTDKAPCPSLDPLLPIRYACLHWIDHLSEIGNDQRHQINLFDDGVVDLFLRGHFLHWMEALSLMRCLTEGAEKLRKLENLLPENYTKAGSIRSLVRDANHFISYNKYIIEIAPLQLYGSALIFCPKQSKIRQHFQHEKLEWIYKCPTVEKDWPSFLRIHERHTQPVKSIAYAPNSMLLASASNDSIIRLWDTGSGMMLRKFQGHSSTINSVAFSSDSKLLASASADGTVRLWEVSTGRCSLPVLRHPDSVNSVFFSTNGEWIASGSADKMIRLWEVKTGRFIRDLEGSQIQPINSVVISHDSILLASASADFTVKILYISTGVQHLELCHDSYVNSVSFSPDSSRLVSTSADCTLRVWDVKTGRLLQKLEGHEKAVNSAVFSPDSKWLASASEDFTVRIWDANSGEEFQKLEGHSDTVISVVFSYDSKYVASAGDDCSIRMWNILSGTLEREVEPRAYSVHSVTFSQDPYARYFASGSSNRAVQLWSTEEGTPIRELKGHTESVNSVVFSYNGKWLATASADRSARVWDVETGELQQTFTNHTGPVNSVAFSRNSKWLASASADTIVRLWDLTRKGVMPKEFRGHKRPVNSVTFSHDSRWLASASADRLIWIWDVLGTDSRLRVLYGHKAPVNAVAFSEDSTKLVSASLDAVILVWDTESREKLREVNIGTAICREPFCLHGPFLLTELGDIDIGLTEWKQSDRFDVVAKQPPRSGYGFSSDREWVTWRGEKVLWLPPEYRPSCSAVAGNRSTIVIGCGSGEVLVIKFSPWMLPFFGRG